MEQAIAEAHEAYREARPKPRDDVQRNTWWMNADGTRLFVVTRLAYGDGNYREPWGYEVFERGNPDSPTVIEARVWNKMVDTDALVKVPPRLVAAKS